MRSYHANIGRRLCAALIDCAPILLISYVIQTRGSASLNDSARSISPYIVAVYLLLRDVAGASPGKFFLGLRVTRFAGAEAGASRRILRNATFAFAALGSAFRTFGGPIRIVGDLIGAIFFLELVSLLVSSERIGDKIADTAVLQAGPPAD